MFVQIQFNHITMKNSFMITVQRVKTKFGQNVLWPFVFQTIQSGLVQSLHFSTHASSKQNSQRQNMVKFYSIKHRKFNLRLLCCSVYLKNTCTYIQNMYFNLNITINSKCFLTCKLMRFLTRLKMYDTVLLKNPFQLTKEDQTKPIKKLLGQKC